MAELTWSQLKVFKSNAVSKDARATDIEIDPQNPNILYASYLGDAIYKSTDGGNKWSPIMNFGFPSPDFTAGPDPLLDRSLASVSRR